MIISQIPKTSCRWRIILHGSAAPQQWEGFFSSWYWGISFFLKASGVYFWITHECVYPHEILTVTSPSSWSVPHFRVLSFLLLVHSSIPWWMPVLQIKLGSLFSPMALLKPMLVTSSLAFQPGTTRVMSPEVHGLPWRPAYSSILWMIQKILLCCWLTLGFWTRWCSILQYFFFFKAKTVTLPTTGKGLGERN